MVTIQLSQADAVRLALILKEVQSTTDERLVDVRNKIGPENVEQLEGAFRVAMRATE